MEASSIVGSAQLFPSLSTRAQLTHSFFDDTVYSFSQPRSYLLLLHKQQHKLQLTPNQFRMATKMIVATALVAAVLATTPTDALTFKTVPHHPRNRSQLQQVKESEELMGFGNTRFRPKCGDTPEACDKFNAKYDEEEELSYLNPMSRPMCAGTLEACKKFYSKYDEEELMAQMQRPICSGTPAACNAYSRFEESLEEEVQFLRDQRQVVQGSEQSEELMNQFKGRLCAGLPHVCMGTRQFEEFLDEKTQRLRDDYLSVAYDRYVNDKVTTFLKTNKNSALTQHLSTALDEDEETTQQVDLKKIWVSCAAMIPECMGEDRFRGQFPRLAPIPAWWA